MNRLAKSCLAAATLALATVAAHADGDIARGAKLAYTCLGCHGIENYKNAYPKYSVPKLGGQHQAYIVAALSEYKSGARWHPTMRGLATTLTDQDRADLAAYFSVTAKVTSAEPVGTPPEQATACVACHGKTGVGTMDEYPNLAGQHADYIAQVLNDYRLGKRKNPLMQPFAQQLSADDIRALARYFSAQKGLVTQKHD
ncbi:MAG TPA: c-type cytochrome [Steroidobacteraceae bacterium]|nr:c-type cytochrome [Steroidobacteraceae bacterium]